MATSINGTATRFFAHLLLIAIVTLVGPRTYADTSVDLGGELRLWHSVALTFDGPEVSETDEENPFVNYRLQVEFTHRQTGKSYNVPGFFAADGGAAESGAYKGNKWRVIFTPDEVGMWHWKASFRKGAFVAVSDRKVTGFTAGFMDGQRGEFNIKKTNKAWPDFRERGRLSYVNEAYLRFEGGGGYFIKAGPDAPENLLAYSDFDGTFHNDGEKDELVKTWSAHERDWSRGDPTWQNGKGKGLIGALNYIASEGMNAVSFLTMNIDGDDRNVFPYTEYRSYERFDVSKLAQWDIVFSHAQSLGLFLHFKTQEVENQGLLDHGGVGLHRQLYYRELIARFGHHLALNWNMGEENGEWHPWNITAPQTTHQRLAMARYFYDHDPYRHHVVIHNGVFYEDLMGADSYYTGASLQTHKDDFSAVHPEVKKIRAWPVTNGRPLAVAVDEPGDAQHSLVPDDVDPQHNMARMNGLWGALTAGAWGTEWYFGYKHAHSDLTAQDWRSRDLFWDQARHALRFFKIADVAYQKATSHDELAKNAWVLADDGEFYILYTKDVTKGVSVKLPTGERDYSVRWYNPRKGGDLVKGSVTTLIVDKPLKQYWEKSEHDLGAPPAESGDVIASDWVILVKAL